jgi:hypothetical protein
VSRGNTPRIFGWPYYASGEKIYLTLVSIAESGLEKMKTLLLRQGQKRFVYRELTKISFFV